MTDQFRPAKPGDTPGSVDIGEGDDPMPLFVLKAKDDLVPRTLLAYAGNCWANGLPDQAAQVKLALDEIEAWRSRHPDLCHLPDHQHVPTAGRATS